MPTARREDIALALCYKDFAFWSGYSSVGLHVAALATAAELRQHCICIDVVPARSNVDLVHALCMINAKRKAANRKPLTHCVIMAPWITPLDLSALVRYFPGIKFAVQSHCNVGALHGDFRGIGNFRNYADLTNDFPNLHVAGNSASFVDWFSEAYDVKMLLLPDLYSIGPMEHRKPWKHPRVLNVGAFGALRSEKNLPSATAAALIMQRRLNVQVRFHMNQGGERKGGNILATIDQMSQGIPGFDVFKHRWTDWKQFIKLVQGMDLLIQPSYTESFNLVTADGIACGVPTVVSEAIRWAPGSWKADSDDPNDIAEVGLKLLANPEERWEGRRVLIDHNERGLKLWQVFLGVKVKHWWDF